MVPDCFRSLSYVLALWYKHSKQILIVNPNNFVGEIRKYVFGNRHPGSYSSQPNPIHKCFTPLTVPSAPQDNPSVCVCIYIKPVLLCTSCVSDCTDCNPMSYRMCTTNIMLFCTLMLLCHKAFLPIVMAATCVDISSYALFHPFIVQTVASRPHLIYQTSCMPT